MRSVQVHDRPVERAEAGQRVAVSLPGVERSEVRRGDVARRARRVSAELPARRRARRRSPRSPARVQLHHGTAETVARVARVGERFAQLRLAQPVVAARGDRVVLRDGHDRRRRRRARSARRRATPTSRRFEAARARRARSSTRRFSSTASGAGRRSGSRSSRAELERAHRRRRSARPRRRRSGRGRGRRPSLPHLGLERRGAKLYRPGAAAELGERAEAAAALEAQLGARAGAASTTRALARSSRSEGRLVRVGDGFAISPARVRARARVLIDGITLAQFRDALGVGRKTAQLSSSASTPTA